MQEYEPAYLHAHQAGLLAASKAAAFNAMKACTLCPRKCGVNRLEGEKGTCKTGQRAWVSSYCPHFGEEAPLVGQNGSGTIFFTHCNLLCAFCQNFDISHQEQGQPVTPDQLARIMLHLQQSGCHNINFVTPSHVVPQILAALEIAAASGLNIPLVYNTGAYDRVTTLKLLDGIIDIYMPDFKFWEPAISRKLCHAPDYPEHARRALHEMHRQVGDLTLDSDGIARGGLIIRHLVMPAGMAGTEPIMQFIAEQISVDSYVNIMTQYRPCGRADEVRGLSNYPSQQDFDQAYRAAADAGLTRLDQPRRLFIWR